MSAKPVKPASARRPAENPAVSYLSAERELLRHVQLRSLSALDEMYSYYGTDRA